MTMLSIVTLNLFMFEEIQHLHFLKCGKWLICLRKNKFWRGDVIRNREGRYLFLCSTIKNRLVQQICCVVFVFLKALKPCFIRKASFHPAYVDVVFEISGCNEILKQTSNML